MEPNQRSHEPATCGYGHEAVDAGNVEVAGESGRIGARGLNNPVDPRAGGAARENDLVWVPGQGLQQGYRR